MYGRLIVAAIPSSVDRFGSALTPFVRIKLNVAREIPIRRAASASVRWSATRQRSMSSSRRDADMVPVLQSKTGLSSLT